MKVALRVVLGLVLVAVVGAAVVASRGSRETIDVTGTDGRSPQTLALRRICLSRKPRRDRRLLERCVRVRGTLLHVWRKHDGEGRVREIHLLVLSHFALYVVKLSPPFPTRFRLGHELTAVGPLVVPHPEHLGIHEVDAFSLSGDAAS